MVNTRELSEEKRKLIELVLSADEVELTAIEFMLEAFEDGLSREQVLEQTAQLLDAFPGYEEHAKRCRSSIS